MSYIRNNQEYLLLFVAVTVLFVGSIGLAVSLRGGNPPAITSFHSLVVALHHK